jgi:hypothetical protein
VTFRTDWDDLQQEKELTKEQASKQQEPEVEAQQQRAKKRRQDFGMDM